MGQVRPFLAALFLAMLEPGGFCFSPLYYRVVVIKAPPQGLCYTVRDAADRCISP